jgi:uncharacterized protein (TIGR02453 family)
MKYFTPAYFDFFKGLSENNHAEWFHLHKSAYEKDVKLPFLALTEDIMTILRDMGVQLDFEAKSTLFRINRDIRFSKNKAPYKLHMSAFISPFGKKSPGMPGFYLQAGHENIMVGGGVYDPDKYQLHKIRWHILHNPNLWEAALRQKDFQKIYGSLMGEKNKILPVEYKDKVLELPLLANKQFYYMHEISNSDFLGAQLKQKIQKAIVAAAPIERLILEAYKD